jgi:membrane-bound lytic murein transglycosylase D
LTLPFSSATIARPRISIIIKVPYKNIFLVVLCTLAALAAASALGADMAPTLDMQRALTLNESLPAPLPGEALAPVAAPVVPVEAMPASSVPADLADAASLAPVAEPVAQPGAQQNDLWQRIRNGYALPEMDSPLIARHEQWYADRPDYVARMMERAQRYLFYITEEVEKRGMPTEIALLPMIESAYNPSAYSIGNASGIWQFIPSTGRNFGLQQNWWYDGRRDIVSATKGALDYLQKLHDQFGDWQLALAAYNWGEGAVERAQEHNRKRGLPTDYASLRMPDETRNYVPKLLAVRNIISRPEKFGLPLPPIPNLPYFIAVNAARHIDTKLVAKLADISLEEFTALNPAHNRPVILQENDNVLLLPVDKADIFKTNLENYKEPLVSWQAYHSRKGERLDRVAPRFGLSVARLKAINGLSPRARLSNGQSLLVPLNDADNEFEAFNTHLVPEEKPAGHTLVHTVKKGETLSTLAHRYHVSVGRLQSWNDNATQLKPGQRITIVQSGVQASHARHLARAGKGHIHLASAKGKRHVARKAPHRVRLASR